MDDERLQPNIYLSELLRSETAVRRGLDNSPSASVMANLRNVLAPGLQRIREALGLPIHITSGYRSPAVNAAVGGAPTSQHLLGLAADFVCPSYGKPSEVAAFVAMHEPLVEFDQLIMEGAWIHSSFVPRDRRGEVLTAHFNGHGFVRYTPGLA